MGKKSPSHCGDSPLSKWAGLNSLSPLVKWDTVRRRRGIEVAEKTQVKSRAGKGSIYEIFDSTMDASGG
jgi:hypothetical protein